MTLFI